MAPALGTRYGEDEGWWKVGKDISTSYLTDHFPQDTSVPISGFSIPGKESRPSRVDDKLMAIHSLALGVVSGLP